MQFQNLTAGKNFNQDLKNEIIGLKSNFMFTYASSHQEVGSHFYLNDYSLRGISRKYAFEGANECRSLKFCIDGLQGILIENLRAGKFFSIAFFNNDENKSLKIMHMLQIRFSRKIILKWKKIHQQNIFYFRFYTMCANFSRIG